MSVDLEKAKALIPHYDGVAELSGDSVPEVMDCIKALVAEVERLRASEEKLIGVLSDADAALRGSNEHCSR